MSAVLRTIWTAIGWLLANVILALVIAAFATWVDNLTLRRKARRIGPLDPDRLLTSGDRRALRRIMQAFDAAAEAVAEGNVLEFGFALAEEETEDDRVAFARMDLAGIDLDHWLEDVLIERHRWVRRDDGEVGPPPRLDNGVASGPGWAPA